MSGNDGDSTTPEGGGPSGESAALGRGRLMTSETLIIFKELRDAVMGRRRFANDSTDLIEQARVERTADL